MAISSPGLRRARALAAVASVTLVLAGCAGVRTNDSAAQEERSAPRDAATPAPTQITRPDATIVTIGDSIMAGFGLDPGDAWPELVAEQTSAPIVNLACSGAGFVMVGDCGADLPTIAADAVSLDPGIVILQSSDNDLEEDPAEIAASTRATVVALHAALPEARIIGMSTLWNAPWEAPESIVRGSAALQSAVDAAGGTFISLGQPFQEDPDLLQWDGEHPTAEGQRVLADRVITALAASGITL